MTPDNFQPAYLWFPAVSTNAAMNRFGGESKSHFSGLDAQSAAARGRDAACLLLETATLTSRMAVSPILKKG